MLVDPDPNANHNLDKMTQCGDKVYIFGKGLVGKCFTVPKALELPQFEILPPAPAIKSLESFKVSNCLNNTIIATGGLDNKTEVA